MVPKDILEDDGNVSTSTSTSDSSDSYSYLLRDIENPNNHINEEWEAIERTLYQESGKHVTDPALLKECKLWRDSFPHIRVRGVGIAPNKDVPPDTATVEEDTTKGVQAVNDNQLSLSKLHEKREQIKKTVVSRLVDRLIVKLGSNPDTDKNIQDPTNEYGHDLGKPKPETMTTNDGECDLLDLKSAGMRMDNESYFERGKGVKLSHGSSLAEFGAFTSPDATSEGNALSDFFADFECNFNLHPPKTSNRNGTRTPHAREFSSNLARNEEILKSGKLSFKIAEKAPSSHVKNDKLPDSLSNVVKPFEMTKKIDKKYEAMLERIMENKGYNSRLIENKRSLKQEHRQFDESPSRKERVTFGHDQYSARRHKELPKLNKFTNNWISRAEENAFYPYGTYERPNQTMCRNQYGDPIKTLRNIERQFKSQSSRSAHDSHLLRNESLLEELEKEVWKSKRSSGLREDYQEGISLQRPQLHNRFNRQYKTAKTQKSSSCGDLPKRNAKPNGKSLKSDLDKRKSELAVKNGAKKTVKNSGKQNLQLPPIETSITCTEIIGKPKMTTRILPKSSTEVNDPQLGVEVKIGKIFDATDDVEISFGKMAKSQSFSGFENVTEIISIFKGKWPVRDWKRYGFFEDDYLAKINVYWLRFPPPDPSSHYILGVLYTFIMVIGVSGNLLFIVTFIRRKRLRTTSNMFIMNLAISDCFLLLKIPIFIYNSFLLGPALGEIGCSIYGFFGGLTGTASIMTLSAIAHDRYQVIVQPLVRKIKQRIYLQILLIWLYSVFFATIPLLDIGFNRYVPEGYLTSCSFDYLSDDSGSRFMIVVFFFAAWVVPVTIIVTSYIAIYRIILKTHRTHKLVKVRHCREMNARKSELKAALIIIIIVCLWMFAWTPYAVVSLLGVTGNKQYITPLSSMIPSLFCKMASCLDPYVYAMTNSRFRDEIKTIIRPSQTRTSQWTSHVERNEACWAMSENPSPIHKLHTDCDKDCDDFHA